MTDPQRVKLTEASKGSRKEQLEGYRDYITAELETKRCSGCNSSQMRAGEQTSMLKFLAEVTKELAQIEQSESKTSRLAGLQGTIAPVTNIDAARREFGRQSRTGDRAPGGGRKAGT